jgi:hypothetical protein
MKQSSKTSHRKSYKQSGGMQTWSDAMANGIKNASKNFRVGHKWYRVGVLSTLFYAEAIHNKLALDRLIEAIDDRCQTIGIYLKEVSSKDFDELEHNTRLIFIKQDLKEQTTYGTLLDNIVNGKMDEDFKKYYASFRYTKLADRTPDGDIFRKSISKEQRQKYKKKYSVDEVMNDIAGESSKKTYKSNYTKPSRRKSKPKERPVYHQRPDIIFDKDKNDIRPRHYKESKPKKHHSKHRKHHSKHRKHHRKHKKKSIGKRATRSKSFFMKKVA